MLLNGQIGPAQSFRGRQHAVRTRDYAALQQAFFDLHLRDLSDNYDFVAFRGGLQPFNSDFRGFIFNDVNLGARIFGNYDNNLWQYNVALFDMREKDSNSELNTFASRNQYVLIANVYRQDILAHGYTAEWSFHANLDRGGRHYDENGNLARPARSALSRTTMSARFILAGQGMAISAPSIYPMPCMRWLGPIRITAWPVMPLISMRKWPPWNYRMTTIGRALRRLRFMPQAMAMRRMAQRQGSIPLWTIQFHGRAV